MLLQLAAQLAGKQQLIACGRTGNDATGWLCELASWLCGAEQLQREQLWLTETR